MATNMSLKIDNIDCLRRSVSQIIQFQKNINISRHFELEIALAIPASKNENITETTQQDKSCPFICLVLYFNFSPLEVLSRHSDP